MKVFDVDAKAIWMYRDVTLRLAALSDGEFLPQQVCQVANPILTDTNNSKYAMLYCQDESTGAFNWKGAHEMFNCWTEWPQHQEVRRWNPLSPLRFTHLTSENGKPQRIIRDRPAYLWGPNATNDPIGLFTGEINTSCTGSTYAEVSLYDDAGSRYFPFEHWNGVGLKRLPHDKTLPCSICFEHDTLPFTIIQRGNRGCGHAYHKRCLDKYLTSAKDCPECRRDITFMTEGENRQFQVRNVLREKAQQKAAAAAEGSSDKVSHA